MTSIDCAVIDNGWSWELFLRDLVRNWFLESKKRKEKATDNTELSRLERLGVGVNWEPGLQTQERCEMAMLRPHVAWFPRKWLNTFHFASFLSFWVASLSIYMMNERGIPILLMEIMSPMNHTLDTAILWRTQSASVTNLLFLNLFTSELTSHWHLTSERFLWHTPHWR